MNPQIDSHFPNSSEPQSGSRSSLVAEAQLPLTQGPQSGPELELWEPPFERWIRLADDLLRDWPHGLLPENRA
jgi:hypothetical protein